MIRKKYKLKYGYIHSDLEHNLLNAVRLLKDKNSSYWPFYTEAGVHEEPGHPETKIQSDGGFSNTIKRIKNISQKLENEQVKSDLQKSCELLQEGIDNHDIGKFFEAHETIHDYDYWVANSPLTLSYAPVDWKGTEVYFGKVSIM